MTKQILSVISVLLITATYTFSQAPNQFNFQAILRDNAGLPLKNQQANLVVSFTNMGLGTLLYRESHNVMTDNFGLFQLSLGNGIVLSGGFINVNFGTVPVSFSGTATLPSGVVINIPDQRLSSVPYALHATTAVTLTGPNDTDINNEINQTFELSGSTLKLKDAGGEKTVDVSSLIDEDADPSNEIQDLQINGSTLSLTGSTTEINLVGMQADDQTAAQVSYDHSTSTLAAMEVQAAIDELQAEKPDNLQEAYAANSLITLDGTHELRVNSSDGLPMLSTSDTNARIGIGTATPLTTLDIRSGTPDAIANISLGNSDNTHRLTFFAGRSSDPNPFIAVHPADPFLIATYDGTNFSEHMRISPSGQLGLGLSTPQTKIHIVGSTSNVTGPLDQLETSLANSIEAGAIFDFSKGSNQGINAGVAALVRGTGTNYSVLGVSNDENATNNRGVYGAASGGDTNNTGVAGFSYGAATDNIGVRGTARDGQENYGVAGYAIGPATNNIAVYGNASGATHNFAGYFVGNVNVIGTTFIQGDLQIGNSGRRIRLGNNSNYSVGEYSLGSVTSGENNVAFGFGTMNSMTSGNANVALGYRAMDYANFGSGNIAIGNLALFSSTASENVAIGNWSGLAIQGGYNVAIGSFSDVINNAQRSVAIGYQAQANQDDAIVLGNAFNVNIKVGIGTGSPQAKLHVANGDARIDGNIVATGSVTASNVMAPSDQRLKKDIRQITDALTTVLQLQGLSYTWKDDAKNLGKRQHGLIAQELEKLLPDLVNTDSVGMKSVNYIALIPFLIESIKEQQQQIVKQQDKIDALKKYNDDFTASIQSQMQRLITLVQANKTKGASTDTNAADEKK
jgi:hypothetical protein